jgi:hypothetical protein
MKISQQLAPPDSLLRTYRGGRRPERWGQYGDCFSVEVARSVTLEEFVLAFYTSGVFRLERCILRLLIGVASTDADARALAQGSQDGFAIWRAGARSDSQLLMCDRYESTRSWFRVLPVESGTMLQFGSAVASARQIDGAPSKRPGFRLLLGFHVLYSKVLLRAAAKRVMAQPGSLKPL